MQNALERAVRYGGRFKGDSSVKSWFYMLNKRAALDLYNKQNPSGSVQVTLSEEDIVNSASDDPFEIARASELSENINYFVDHHFDAKTKVILGLVAMGIAYHVISSQTGISIPAIKVRIHRARAKMKQHGEVF